jgi:CDP-diacylglycerol--serine O-phosphatidyltransferase
MSDVDDSPARPRGVYWLPNLLTTGALFAGFYAIVAAIDLRFEYAGIAVFVAMIFDGLDGRVARWTQTASVFGKEYDSLSDMVSFGVAPAIVTYQWGVARIAEYGPLWRRIGWLVCFFYAAAAALRLARFNSRAATQDKHYFEGLPVGGGNRRGPGLAGQRSNQYRIAGIDSGVFRHRHCGRAHDQPLRVQQFQIRECGRKGPLHLHRAGAAGVHIYLSTLAHQLAGGFRLVRSIGTHRLGLPQTAAAQPSHYPDT